MGSAVDAEGKELGDADTAEGQYKTAAVFPAGSAMNVTKTLTFSRKGPFDVKAEYEHPEALLPGTPKELGSFRIEASTSEAPKKIQARR